MNTYNFDWDIIAQKCPEYKKYLVNIYDRTTVDEDEDEKVAETQYVPTIGNTHKFSEQDIEILREVSGTTSESLNRQLPERLPLIDRQVDVCQPSYLIHCNVKYNLHEKYVDIPLNGKKINPLQLMPPKWALGVGSKLLYQDTIGSNLCYEITNNHYIDGSVNLCKNKVVEKGDKIQLIQAVYWFNRTKHVTSEYTSRFKCLTYNKKTKRLYYIHKTPNKKPGKKKRYNTAINGILWDLNLVNQASNVPVSVLLNFVKRLEKAVIKDVPDAYIPEYPVDNNTDTSKKFTIPNEPNQFLKHKILILVFQHKVMGRLEWLTTTVLRNLNSIMESATKEVTESFYFHDEFRKLKRNRVRRIIPQLRVHKSPNTLAKAVCGKSFSKLVPKLMRYGELCVDNWQNLLWCFEEDKIPKVVYHWLNYLVKQPDNVDNNLEMIKETISAIYGIVKNKHSTRTIATLEMWIKINKRFSSQGSTKIPWITWRDLYTMANQLGIKVRPTKFNDPIDVKERHDLFAKFTNRNKSLMLKYTNVVFKELESPNKEYDGFKFIQLRTAKELIQEGTNVYNCVGSYANRCAIGHSIIFSMRKNSKSYVTIELNGHTYELVQKHTLSNEQVKADHILNLIDAWHKDVCELHKNDTKSYRDKCEHIAKKISLESQIENVQKLLEESNDKETIQMIEKQLVDLNTELTYINDSE
jgi:hypothetical protein